MEREKRKMVRLRGIERERETKIKKPNRKKER